MHGHMKVKSPIVMLAICGSLGFSEMSLCFLQNTQHDFP